MANGNGTNGWSKGIMGVVVGGVLLAFTVWAANGIVESKSFAESIKPRVEACEMDAKDQRTTMRTALKDVAEIKGMLSVLVKSAKRMEDKMDKLESGRRNAP
jgi:hypothetical protein